MNIISVLIGIAGLIAVSFAITFIIARGFFGDNKK